MPGFVTQITHESLLAARELIVALVDLVEEDEIEVEEFKLQLRKIEALVDDQYAEVTRAAAKAGES